MVGWKRAMSALVEAWFGGASRVLFVHAHPDDETIATGGTLAALAESGRTPLLVTLTRGERGEVTPGPLSELRGADLAAHREGELAAALAALGVEQHAYLGNPPARARGLSPRHYEDSGMEWADGSQTQAVASVDAPATALTRAPAVEALNDLVALADAWGAEAMVSYDANGGYGHPDHVFAHRAARAVAQALELPFWQVEAGAADPTRDEDHHIEPWLARKVAALEAHATQLTVDGEDIVHVGGQRHPIRLIERFSLLD